MSVISVRDNTAVSNFNKQNGQERAAEADTRGDIVSVYVALHVQDA